ncbi:ParB/RepB/Spo0J family partition protein [Rhodobacteraceae bacterium 2CG4]|uniref:ParB/RepB/Spo0J family partition protein n=1 Tax=Halovulum marinum TaxID=2662447 RepID=A0A6L5Z2B8_9RHOB|nr:ParB/RepB/Spo0J family partition protein [Halovulum marinum]MSU90668.1 ParB/RepB/Spo0J family partition protein [Halovulum marinum]
MARKTDRKGLGRGLSALLADTADPEAAEGAAAPRVTGLTVDIDRIQANPDQPRRSFGEDELNELAASIRRNGIIQPLVVRPDPDDPDTYQLVAGERRWRAAQRAQVHEVPVVVRELSDEEVLEVAIVENVQRVDLNAVEEAQGYKQLMDRFGHGQETIAEALGKSRSHIANTLRLLNLPAEVIEHLRAGRLSAGHARTLIPAQDPAALAREVIAKGLSVRQTESLVRAEKDKNIVKQRVIEPKDADTRAIEADLSAQLKMRVSIDHAPGNDGGTMKIKYRSLDDLDRLLGTLSGG